MHKMEEINFSFLHFQLLNMMNELLYKVDHGPVDFLK